MEKRKSSELIKEIYDTIKKNPDITMSSLERKMRTNPTSLKDHCEALEYLGVIKIKRLKGTRKLKVVK